MNRKNKTVTFVLQLVIVLLFFTMLCFPLTLMALDGPDNTEIESEAATELLPLNLRNYVTGAFHKAFEPWFSHHYPMRSSVVGLFRDFFYRLEMSKPAIFIMDALTSVGEQPSQETPTPETPTDPMAIYTDPSNMYAEINKKQMADTPVEPKGFKGSNAVHVGKSGYLYEAGYINEYYGFGDYYANFDYSGVDETVHRLLYIQDELAERYGIVMLYIISSSKASQYADYIPDHYKNRYIIDENYVRPVDYMRPLLAASTINYLDSSAYFKEIGLLATFPKTGIHWNHVASFEATAELVRMYADISHHDVKLLDTQGVIKTPTIPAGGNNDQDVFNILYGALDDATDAIIDDEYYAPDVVVTNENAPRINVLLQGASFTADIEYYLETYDVANVRRIYGVGDRHDPWGANNPWKRGIMVWDDILVGLDLIIFEATEAMIHQGHCLGDDWLKEYTAPDLGSNAIYDSLYEFLMATE